MIKPISLAELRARLRALLRRAERNKSPRAHALTIGDLRIDPRMRRAWLNEQELQLTPKEFELLAYLMRNRGVVVPRDQLLRDVWGGRVPARSQTLDVHIRWLRQKVEPNPDQPRMIFDADALHELAASIREHGVLQPILVRPLGANRYQLVAGERRWRASKEAGLDTIPALVEELDDDTALEIAIIENLQREDLSPLEEATMYDRMVRDHGYSIRKLADKLGKDKGYVENRLRLADAPEEIRQLVSVRKDTLSHAYELLKVGDEKKRRRLAARVASGELSLVKLRERIEGRPTRVRPDGQFDVTAEFY